MTIVSLAFIVACVGWIAQYFRGAYNNYSRFEFATAFSTAFLMALGSLPALVYMIYKNYKGGNLTLSETYRLAGIEMSYFEGDIAE